MKQIGLSVLMYVQDYDELTPLAYQVVLTAVSGSGKAFNASWRWITYPYNKNTNVLQCPSNPNNKVFVSAGFDASIGIKTSYSANVITDTNLLKGAFGRTATFGSPQVDVSLAEMAAPANLIGIVENANSFADYSVTSGKGFYTSTTDQTVTDSTATDPNGVPFPGGLKYVLRSHMFAGHAGRLNVFFMDGHAKSLRPVQTIQPSDPGACGVTTSPNMWLANQEEFTDSYPAGLNAYTNCCSTTLGANGYPIGNIPFAEKFYNK